MFSQKIANKPKLKLFLMMILASIVLSGCELLPGHGPTSLDLALTGKDQKIDQKALSAFAIVEMTAETIPVLGHSHAKIIGSALGKSAKARVLRYLGVGDILAINVWEASSDGLFSSTERKQTQINAVVDQKGNIFVPYIGQIHVAGLAVDRVRTIIAEGFKGKAIDPQVQVVLTRNAGDKLTIVGDVSSPGRVEVPINGLKLIEAIALAGGSKNATYETEVFILRGNRRASVRLDDIVKYASNNIWLKSRDVIQVLHHPRSFSTFGAVSVQTQQKFQTETVSLAEALAQSGGLNDNLANAGGVFLFRFETKTRLNKAGIRIPNSKYSKGIPTIYRLNFKQPQAFFTASQFMINDKDIIYVANAPTVEFQKFISAIVSPVLGITSAVKTIVK